MDAVNQEREMFGQQSIKSPQPVPIEVQPYKEEKRPWWNKALGAVDAMTGGLTDFDGMGSKGQIFEKKPSSDVSQGLVQDGSKPRTIILPAQEVKFPVAPQSTANKSLGLRGRVNSSQDLIRQITLNNLQYT